MKLLITLDFPPEIGGIQNYLRTMVQFTFSSNDRVFAGCANRPRISYKEISANITWVSTPISRWEKKISNIPLLFHLAKLLIFRKKNIPEIFCGNVFAGFAPWILSFFTRLPYTVYVYGTELEFLQKKSFRGWFLKKILLKAAALYAISHFTASLLKNAGIRIPIEIYPPRVVLLPPKKKIDDSLHTKSLLPDEKEHRILCVGRLIARKGFANAVSAIAMLPASVCFRLIIAGSGPCGPSLRSLCREKKVADCVEFKEALTDRALQEEYDLASLFLLPGSCQKGVEGFGIVLIEAMAHNIPVIAGRTGGVAEVLDNGSCGILVEPDDVTGLSSAIQRLLADERLRRQLTKSAFERVKKYYAW